MTASDFTLSSTPAARGRRSLRPEQLALFAVVLAAVLPYLAALTFGYVYDDLGVITDMPARQSWHGVWHSWIESYWGNPETGLYRPVVQFLFSFIWMVGRGAPWLYHACALAAHVGATLLVWRLFQRALSAETALLAAMLFGVDPVHVEAVANIANSSEVLVALLGVTMVLLVLAAEESAGDGGIGWRAATGVALVYLLALGTKESSAGLPGIAFLCWWGWRSLRERAPGVLDVLRRGWRVWLLATLALAVYVLVRYEVLGGLTVKGDWVAWGIRDVPLRDRVWTMVAAWPIVGRLLFWPVRLSMHYGNDAVPPLSTITPRAAISLGVCGAALLLAALLARRGDRRPLAAIAWIVLAYLPASNILVPTGQLLAERTLYLASAGAAMLVGWALVALVERAPHTLPASMWRMATVGGAAFALGVGMSVAFPATLLWQDNYTLFQSGMKAAPMSSRPYWLMGNWYVAKGDDRRGVAYLAHAHHLDPANPVIVYYYTRELHSLGAHPTELGVLRDAVQRIPQSEQVWVMYLIALGEVRGPDSVIALVRASPPRDSTAMHWQTVFLGDAFARKGMPDSTLAVYRAALARQPRSGMIHYLYAKQLLQMGRVDPAVAELSAAERYGGARPEAMLRLKAEIALARGDTTQARQSLARARALAPLDSNTIELQHKIGAS